MTALSQDARDQVRVASARQAAKVFADVMDRRGATPEVLALVAEGMLAGIVNQVWRNRTKDHGTWWVRRVLHSMLRAAIREVCRVPR